MSDQTSAPIRPSQTANSDWPQPELSLGAPHASMDIRDRFKFWEIKNNSPAHQVWGEISEAITNLLEGKFMVSTAEDADIIVEMFMIAQKMGNPSPTVIFRSQINAARQTAMDVVEKGSIMAPFSGVLMASCCLGSRIS